MIQNPYYAQAKPDESSRLTLLARGGSIGGLGISSQYPAGHEIGRILDFSFTAFASPAPDQPTTNFDPFNKKSSLPVAFDQLENISEYTLHT